MSKLYVVATPIGNLEDITYRAVRTLSEVDIIVAEDTRHTKILLDRYSISKQISSYHKFNIKSKTGYFIDLLNSGKNLALVSDAGSPCISDPGFELVRAAVEAGVEVVTIPGPSSVISALSISGFSTDKFTFLGFLPRKDGKIRKLFQSFEDFEGAIVFFESPYRIVKTLEVLNGIWPSKNIVVFRELTKKFEEGIRGTISSVTTKLLNTTVKGEIVVVIESKN